MAMQTTVCQEKDKDERTSQEVSLKTVVVVFNNHPAAVDCEKT